MQLLLFMDTRVSMDVESLARLKKDVFFVG